MRLRIAQFGCVCLCVWVLAATAAEQFDLTLEDGWNFVSIPIVPTDPGVDAVFGSAYDGPVWGWDGRRYRIVAELEPGQAYWVYHPAPGDGSGGQRTSTVSVEGTPVTSADRPLEVGWNAVGVLPDYVRPGDAAIRGQIMGWDAALQQSVSVSGSAFTPGQGYWIYATSQTIINFLAHTVTGSVVGDGVEGVLLTLTAGIEAQTVSDQNGDFSFQNLGSGVYQLTPAAAGIEFDPPSMEVVLQGSDVDGVVFTASRLPAVEALVAPDTGATLRPDGGNVAATVPAGALAAGDPVTVTLWSLPAPSVPVAESATVLSGAARLELPGDAIETNGTADIAYAFELSPNAGAPADTDARYLLGAIRIRFYDRDSPQNTYHRDVYAALEDVAGRDLQPWQMRVPIAAVARLRAQAESALGAAVFSEGRAVLRFEAAVVDVSGAFGRIQNQAQDAGAGVVTSPSSALDRDVEVFMLRWNPATQSFDSSEPAARDAKRVVVLLHGWQPLAGFGSDAAFAEPHLTTWKSLMEYATGAAQDGPDRRGDFEFYTVRYDSDQRVYDNALAIWKALSQTFPNRHVTVLTHGAGGLVAYAMQRQFHPDGTAFAEWTDGGIDRVVSLNAPYHGTPLVQMLQPGGLAAPQDAVAVEAPLAFLALGTPGTLDLAWDRFDSTPLALWGNANLLALNALEPLDLSRTYVTYATGPFAGRTADDDALAAIGERIRTVFGSDYDNDGVVPVLSARMVREFQGAFLSRTSERGASVNGYNHVQIAAGQESGDLNSDQYDETLFDSILAALTPQPEGLAFIPGGPFEMGDAIGEGYPNERPVHTVALSPYYIGRTEITNAQMRDAMQWAYDNGRVAAASGTVENVDGEVRQLLDLDSAYIQIFFYQGVFTVINGKENYPCVAVTWYGAAAYANYRSEMEGRSPCYDPQDWSCDFSKNGYRLPTEAQWEKAARGGLAGKRYSWGDTINHSQANYDNGVAAPPMVVGSFAANDYGVYETTGNVWEWCYDRYVSSWYSDPDATGTDPTGPATGAGRVLRGGSASDSAYDCRNSRRDQKNPASSDSLRGFRIALPF